MKTILITGGAGFIGSNFVRYLYENYPSYRLIVLDALTYAGNIENLPVNINDGPNDRLTFWYGNVRNGELMDTLVAQSDVIVHFAAETHVSRSIYDNYVFFETDVLGTQTVANAALKYKDSVERFIHISTSEVYGSALKEKMDEHHPLNPMSPYASAKCGADRLIHSYWATFGMPAVIVRPFNNYGPYQHLEKVVPRFITSCLTGEPLTVHGDGTAARDWLFVQDHCEALEKILHIEREKVIGEAINLGTGRDTSVIEIGEIVRDAMKPSNSPIQYIGERPGQVSRHTCEASKAKELLGWEPRVSLEQGLDQTIRWYRDHEAWWRPQVWMRHIPIVNVSGERELH